MRARTRKKVSFLAKVHYSKYSRGLGEVGVIEEFE